MELTLLTTPGCPHREVFEQRLAQALAGRAVTIVRHEVDDAAQAQRLGLRGSPTLLIDGTDPFAVPGEPAGISCRLYRLPDGSVDGAPSVDQLRAALNGCGASGWGTGTTCSVPRSSWGWSSLPRAAESRLKRAADWLRPRTGRPLAARYAMVLALIALAVPLPVRGTLIVDTLAAGGWCAVNFWRCGHAHYAVTSGGWLWLAVFTAAAAADDGRSTIDAHEQHEQLVFLAILAVALTFETLWCAVRHASALRCRQEPGHGR